MSTKELVWDDKYSVGVEEIDDQHKQLFKIINEIFDSINTNITEIGMKKIADSLVEYKIIHFATEENYFRKFNYERTESHVLIHHSFTSGVAELQEKYANDSLTFAFKLADFMEDWLLGHIMSTDQEYKQCFKEHGLK